MKSRPDANAIFTALPDFVLGVTFLATWIAPERMRDGIVGYLLLTILLEFIIVHSSAFMGTVAIAKTDRRRKVVGILGLGVFYSLFAAGFALSFSTWWPFVAFWMLTANRLLGVILHRAPEGEEEMYIRTSWAAGAVFYLLAAGLTVVPPVPRFGLTPAFVAAEQLPGGGLWIDEPHRAIAFGVIYYFMMTWSELRGHRWARSGLPRTKPVESKSAVDAPPPR